MSAEPPATPDTIAAFEAKHRFVLPDAYRQLLALANGFEVGKLVVLGTHDAYRLDIPGPDRLVLTPPDELGAHVLGPNGSVRFVDFDDDSSEGRMEAADLRMWVRRKVAPKEPAGR